MNRKAILVPYNPSYADDVIRLMDDTIHRICSADYSADEIREWSPAGREKSIIDKLGSTYSIIALIDEVLAGFGNAVGTEIDCLYVSAEHQREGIGSILLESLENHAFRYGDTIHVYASLTAEGFFLSHGYHPVRRNIVERNGVRIPNWYMEKSKGCSRS